MIFRPYTKVLGMKTTLSTKRQVSIPKRLCDKLALKPGSKIAWEETDGKLVGRPVPANVLDTLTGIHKGGPDLVAQLLKQRREDRERENGKLAR
jgi:AbrB family looped-hinge helix DNA binding protein